MSTEFERGASGGNARHKETQEKIKTSTGPVKVTISGGLLLSRDWGSRPVEELLSEADAALYAAKCEGRNCITLAKPDVQREAVGAAAPQSADHSD